MNLKTVAICIAMASSGEITAAEVDSTEQYTFSGTAYTEVNYGHNYYGENREDIDFPHIVVDGELNLNHGWSIYARLEYERLYEDGTWENSFKNNFTTDLLYLNKSWSNAINVKAGIINIPVGQVNSEGTALTIYDPESEAALLPMKWHEGGAMLWGGYGKLEYSASILVYGKLPFNESRVLGGSARLDYHPAEFLRIGASSFLGSNRFCGAIDTEMQFKGIIADGSIIYSDKNSAKSAGIEFGYDLMSFTEYKGLFIIPFARYDGVFNTETPTMNKWTLGFNLCPITNFTIKAEYGWRHYRGTETERTFDIGVGYSIEF